MRSVRPWNWAHCRFVHRIVDKVMGREACPPVRGCDSQIQVGPLKMPMYGLGTWQIEPENVALTIKHALDMGIRHIDTSPCFGNEAAIGDALELIYEEGEVCREDLFISSKLPHYAMKPEMVKSQLKKSLMALKTAYVDLYMLSFPAGVTVTKDKNYQNDETTDHCEIWEAMEELTKTNACALGLSNFNSCQIENILKCAKIPPTNLQIELHVYNQQCELREFACCHGISVTAYAPLGSPGLIDYLNENEHPSNETGAPLKDRVVSTIAAKCDRQPAQILLRYWLQKGVAVIPKSEKPGRLCSNFNVFDFQLDKCDMETLEALDKGKYGRMFTHNVWVGTDKHPEYPWKDEL